MKEASYGLIKPAQERIRIEEYESFLRGDDVCREIVDRITAQGYELDDQYETGVWIVDWLNAMFATGKVGTLAANIAADHARLRQESMAQWNGYFARAGQPGYMANHERFNARETEVART